MPFVVDVELTLLERMSASFFNGGSPAPPPQQATPPAQAQLNFTLQCDSIDAILR